MVGHEGHIVQTVRCSREGAVEFDLALEEQVGNQLHENRTHVASLHGNAKAMLSTNQTPHRHVSSTQNFHGGVNVLDRFHFGIVRGMSWLQKES